MVSQTSLVPPCLRGNPARPMSPITSSSSSAQRMSIRKRNSHDIRVGCVGFLKRPRQPRPEGTQSESNPIMIVSVRPPVKGSDRLQSADAPTRQYQSRGSTQKRIPNASTTNPATITTSRRHFPSRALTRPRYPSFGPRQTRSTVLAPPAHSSTVASSIATETCRQPTPTSY
ncbi:hypothetical protein EW146_g10494 [Bondarzewia mesenterica]|uniref:Uncharacterized protein n=1 Tax=Bondarzewia mesenterica TaxID=1095465 RepID=A0A4S4KWQ8_9AGAM|nr:hypothetical protein EW146_g10494 [Bondarzewia mesenterica]